MGRLGWGLCLAYKRTASCHSHVLTCKQPLPHTPVGRHCTKLIAVNFSRNLCQEDPFSAVTVPWALVENSGSIQTLGCFFSLGSSFFFFFFKT